MQGSERFPKVFKILCAVEVWERFSFYLMKTLLALYLFARLGFTEDSANLLVGYYVTAVYLAPIPGGWFADARLGYVTAAGLGGIVMALGHVAMTVESRTAMFLALGLLAVGNGLFKPSMQAMLRGAFAGHSNELYSRGQSVFYLGINAGAAAAVGAAALLRKLWGWHVAFGSAAIGLGIGLVIMAYYRKDLAPMAGAAHATEEIKEESIEPDEGQKWGRVAVVLALTLFAAAFWAGFHQDGGPLQFFALHSVRRGSIPPEMFNQINPVCVLVLTIPLVWFFVQFRVSPTTKFALGLAISSASWALLAVFASHGRVSPWWLVAYYVGETVAELLVSPNGNAIVGKIAPKGWVARLQGVWLASSAIGGWAAGQIGSKWSVWSHRTFFGVFVAICGVAAIVVMLTRKRLDDLIADSKAQDETRPGLKHLRLVVATGESTTAGESFCTPPRSVVRGVYGAGRS